MTPLPLLLALALQVSPIAPASRCTRPEQANCRVGATPYRPTPSVPPPLDVRIAKVLNDSAAAWSHDDLDGFMDAYERGPETTFVTSTGLVKGWDAMRDRYRRRYGAGAALGPLAFSDLEVRPLGPDYAIAYGRFHLHQPGADNEETGVFDLVMHRSSQGWRIISDHTS